MHLEVCVNCKHVVVGIHDARLLVLRYPALEEVGLALEGNELHEVKGVLGAKLLGVTECCENAVSHELDVLAHQVRVHANHAAGDGVANEVLFVGDRFLDDALYHVKGQLVLELRIQELSKLLVEALVAADELVGQTQTGHEPPVAQPENGAERPGEQKTLHAHPGDEALCEGAVARKVFRGPRCLLSHGRDRLDSLEELVTLGLVLNKSIKEQGVLLAVDALIVPLVSVEHTCRGVRDFLGKVVVQVLHHHAIAACKEAEDVLDEVALIIVQFFTPVYHILVELDLLHGPESGNGLLVHLENVGVPDGERRVLACTDVSEEGLNVGGHRYLLAILFARCLYTACRYARKKHLSKIACIFNESARIVCRRWGHNARPPWIRQASSLCGIRKGRGRVPRGQREASPRGCERI
ncbi:hypothetical protein ATCV1_z034R [Acanthocystis turfacea chlorella virus 1]|uniref:Uncharacterized protein z034R n=1 Tax=Chlorovirus heliozoae TaxID=322019 RepID=A7K7Z4_9PHYC|nr:hypothetical protein ATCV1_z034R [Acanthocystis turfacea chlorella virus 1]ABT16168.1 hypothetical protein ATCV1_z034R [Acanthocystis turfacea chlorella virus 1]